MRTHIMLSTQHDGRPVHSPSRTDRSPPTVGADRPTRDQEPSARPTRQPSGAGQKSKRFSSMLERLRFL